MRVDRGDGKRPDSITVFPSPTREVCTDANIYCLAVSLAHAAPETEKRKRRMYGAPGALFRVEPITVEAASVYGESTVALISEIGGRITKATGESRETALCILTEEKIRRRTCGHLTACLLNEPL